MTRVYLVWHTHRHTETGYDDEKLIGVYTEREKAEQAISRLRVQPGFNRLPNDFEICEYPLDVDHWTEGFGVNDDI